MENRNLQEASLNKSNIEKHIKKSLKDKANYNKDGSINWDLVNDDVMMAMPSAAENEKTYTKLFNSAADKMDKSMSRKENTEESMQLTKNAITKSGNSNVMKSFKISKLKNDLAALRKNLKQPNPGSPKRGPAYEAKTEIKKGDTVRLKKKYADGPAEAKMDYIVKELRGPRVLIAPKVWKSGGIVPTESVQMYMIEKPAMAEATTEITQIKGLTEMTDKHSAIFDKLKKNDNVKIKFDSTLSKGGDFVEYKVLSKTTVLKGKPSEQEKITLQAKSGGVKSFLRRKKDGKITFAIGDLGASLIDMKEGIEYVDEAKLPAKKIIKDLEAKMSIDVIVGKYIDKRSSNRDAILKIIRDYNWNKFKQNINSETDKGDEAISEAKTGQIRIIDLSNAHPDNRAGAKAKSGFQVQKFSGGKFVNQGAPYSSKAAAEKVRGSGQHTMQFESLDEAVLRDRDYEVKNNKVYISKANFKKIHKDFKIARKGDEMMMVNGGSKGSILVPVEFTESVEEARQLKNPKTEVMVVDKAGKTIVIDKTKQKEYLAKGWKLAESVNETTTPMRNRFGPAVDSKKFDAYKKHMKANKLDEPTVRMAHQNPDDAESKRMMKNPAYSKGLELYKASIRESNLDEATMSRVAKELEDYARKHGGIDKMDFIKAAMMMKKGQTAQLKKFVDDLDTEPREKILSLMDKDSDRRKEYKAFQKNIRNEEIELDEGVKERAVKALMTKALGGKRAKAGTTSRIADNGDFIVTDGGGRIIGRLKADSFTNPLEEAAGTSAKYKDNKGLFGGKYTSSDRAAAMSGKKFIDWRNKKQSKNDDEHKKSDPKMFKKGYAKHMVDIDKAEKNAKKRGIKPTFDKHKAKNGLNKGKLPSNKDYVEVVSEGVIDDLRKIVNTKSAGAVKFASGSKTKVDMFTASAMVKVHDSLNDANKKKFADAINKDETRFMKMMDFAMSKVK